MRSRYSFGLPLRYIGIVVPGSTCIDITGQRFGKWLAVARTHHKKKPRWLCRCDCGAVREVSSSTLRAGKTNSCGCMQGDRAAANVRRSFRGEYVSWVGMRNRCRYPGHVEYHRYGGRGIQVCDRWDSFERFLEDMGPRPAERQIDRVDPDGHYCPENCRWATRHEQTSNTSKNVRVEYEGRTFTLKQLADHLGLSYFRLHAYYRRRGLPLEEAIAKVRLPGIRPRVYRSRAS